MSPDPQIDGAPKTIEHDPYEFSRKSSPWFWLSGLLMLAALWMGAFAFMSIDWQSVVLGFGTAGMFFSWAFDVTDGKVPASWRTKPPPR